MPETIEAIREGTVATAIVQKPYDWGIFAIKALLGAMTGNKIPDPRFVETYDITMANVDQLKKKA